MLWLTILPNINKFRHTGLKEVHKDGRMDGDHYYVPQSGRGQKAGVTVN